MIHGNFDYNTTPLAPPGCKIAIHDRADERKSWAEHATRGYYVGPALKHYRNYQCYMPITNSLRVSNTVEFFPQNWTIPTFNLQDRLEESLGELLESVKALVSQQSANKDPTQQHRSQCHQKPAECICSMHLDSSSLAATANTNIQQSPTRRV